MEFYKEGDHSKALCSGCKKVVITTFTVRNAVIKDENRAYRVPGVLVAVCDECDRTVAVPQQSFPAVAEVRKKAEKVSIEVRLPRHLVDVLNNSIAEMGLDLTSDLPSQLIKLFLARFTINAANIRQLRSNLDSDLLDGTFRKPSRFSMKASPALADQISNILAAADLNKTELVDATIVQVKKDLLDHPNKDVTKSIRDALLACG